ncbi:MAG: alpha-E domain-containing protein [Muribaculaceae bacterium]
MYCIANVAERHTISAVKANRLYWLGRYAERVYLSLHLMRRYWDRMIDGGGQAYKEYYSNLDVYNTYGDDEAFSLGHMYDPDNRASILSGLTAANDNAILLREEIKSETLSYVQMSLALIERCAADRDKNITSLQPVTDNLLAFWGSVDSRPLEPQVRCLLRIGKLVEDADMHVRFGYPFARVREYVDELESLAGIEPGVFDRVCRARLHELLCEARYPGDSDYRRELLGVINRLVTL